MPRIIGSFIFRESEDGNLISQFRNNGTANSQIETSIRRNIINNLEGFAGTYLSKWNEDDGEAILEITRLNNNEFFNLVWSDLDTNKPKFFGQGMQYENSLVGCYWNIEMDAFVPRLV